VRNFCKLKFISDALLAYSRYAYSGYKCRRYGPMGRLVKQLGGKRQEDQPLRHVICLRRPRDKVWNEFRGQEPRHSWLFRGKTREISPLPPTSRAIITKVVLCAPTSATAPATTPAPTSVSASVSTAAALAAAVLAAAPAAPAPAVLAAAPAAATAAILRSSKLVLRIGPLLRPGAVSACLVTIVRTVWSLGASARAKEKMGKRQL